VQQYVTALMFCVVSKVRKIGVINSLSADETNIAIGQKQKKMG